MRKNNDFIFENKRCGDGYKNPLTREFNTPDPCIVYCNINKCYFATHTSGGKDNAAMEIVLHRSEKLSDIMNAETAVVYKANPDDKTYGCLWAPELHFIDGRWYIYTSTRNSETDNMKHVICLRAKTDNPFDGFEFAAHINPNLFAIDPTIYQDKKNNKLYISYSLVVDDPNQAVAIQELKSPTEPIGKYEIISRPQYDWERVPPYHDDYTINEGSYFIEKGDRLFMVYSSNGCWSDDYVLGIMEFVGDDIMSADSWVKDSVPFMRKGNGNFGSGHAHFFHSPDNTELWMCYHCLKESNPRTEPMERYCHCQKVFFDETGYPHVGMPVETDVGFAPPSGE